MYKEIANILEQATDDDIVLYKGDVEFDQLVKWLSSEPKKIEETFYSTDAQREKRTLSHSDVQTEAVSAVDLDTANDSIADIIEKCNLCPDVAEKKRGLGDGTSGIMIILNSPPLVTSFEKEQLRKESVVLLKKIVSAIKVDLFKTYTTNMIKCESNNPILKPSAQFQHCSKILEREIEMVKPNIVLVMGELTPLRRMRKKFLYASWYEIPHPISMIKKPTLKREAWAILQEIMKTLDEVKK